MAGLKRRKSRNIMIIGFMLFLMFSFGLIVTALIAEQNDAHYAPILVDVELGMIAIGLFITSSISLWLALGLRRLAGFVLPPRSGKDFKIFQITLLGATLVNEGNQTIDKVVYR
jgi:hypothetical protein